MNLFSINTIRLNKKSQAYMKRILLTAGTLLLLVFLLLHPQEGLTAARTGMTLWLNSLIPALLPFIILTGVLIHTGSIEKILLPFRPLFEFLLGVSVYGWICVSPCWLCGYPWGAKLASDSMNPIRFPAGKRNISQLSATMPVLLLLLHTWVRSVC